MKNKYHISIKSLRRAKSSFKMLYRFLFSTKRGFRNFKQNTLFRRISPFRRSGVKTLKIATLLFLVLSTFLVSAQEDLNNYLKTAAENNPGLKALFNEYMAALEVAPQVKALPDPQVAFGYFIQPVETRVGPQQFKISASQMFPWFGTLKAKENAADRKSVV